MAVQADAQQQQQQQQQSCRLRVDQNSPFLTMEQIFVRGQETSSQSLWMAYFPSPLLAVSVHKILCQNAIAHFLWNAWQ